jgi:hypothetical protein
MDPVEIGVSSPRIVLDGIRRKFGRLRLYRTYGTASLIPVRKAGQNLAEHLNLRADERGALNACDGRQSVLEIARATGTNEIDTLAILYGLTTVGLLEADAKGNPALAQLSADVETRALAPTTADKLPGYSELVQAMHGGVQSTDYFQILGVDRGATQAEIQAAYEDVSRRFDPHRVSRDSPIWVQVKEISIVVQDAYRLLSNERLRTRYETAIS